MLEIKFLLVTGKHNSVFKNFKESAKTSWKAKKIHESSNIEKSKSVLEKSRTECQKIKMKLKNMCYVCTYCTAELASAVHFLFLLIVTLVGAKVN